MMTPLPNVRQAYSLLVQEDMQCQVTSEFIENLSTVQQCEEGNIFKIYKDKLCEHCNRTGYTIDEC